MKIADLIVEYETHTYKDSQGNVWRVNDEGDKELVHSASGSSYRSPSQAKPQMIGMYFYDIQPEQEQKAAAYGIKQTKNGKWAKIKYNTSGRTFDFQRDQADKEFGPGKWWSPKQEGVAEGTDNYSEQLAQQIFDKRQDITSEDEVLNQAYHIVANDLGQKRARYMFNYDEDFPSDVVSNYFYLQKKSVAESASAGGTSSGSIATVTNPGGKPASQVGSLFGGTYGNSKKKAKVIKRAS